MRDAVGLLNKSVVIDGISYTIIGFYVVPANCDLYVKLQKPNNMTINYPYATLQPYLVKQIRL